MNTNHSYKGTLRIGEAADYLGVSVETVRRWDEAGKIESTRTLGNQRRYNPEDLAEAVRRAS